MSFSITLSSARDVDDEGNDLGFEGTIELNGSREAFVANTDLWAVDDYQKHWYESLARVVQGAPSSCLIVGTPGPGHEAGGMWWLLYRVGRKVVFQEAIFMASPGFRLEDPYASVPERELTIPMPSEWEVSVEDIEHFLAMKSSQWS